MRILGIAGSLRQESHNRRLLAAAGMLLPAQVSLEVFDHLRSVPPFDEDVESSAPLGVGVLRRAIAEADAVLFATPEYNSSIPGVLKNAVDWASRPRTDAALANTPVVVIGASTGMFGAVWAQAELRKVLAAAGARVLDRELAVPTADEAFTADGALADADQELALAGMLLELAEMVSLRAAA